MPNLQLFMNKPIYTTILFDMDGVVIDSEKLHLEAMALSLDKHDIAFDRSILQDYIGRSDESFFQFVFDNIDSSTEVEVLLEEKNHFFEELLKELQFVDGFKEFIKFADDNGLQAGLVTSSSKFTVNKVNKLLNIAPYFEVIVAEEDTQKHKPNPDPYLLAALKLSADKDKTLVIEDSINGIISGKKAGCVVSGLTTSFDKNTLLDAGADFVVDSYAELVEKITK